MRIIKRYEHVITKMPGLAGTVPRQILIEGISSKPLYAILQCFKQQRCSKTE